jgi:hypothetical protein
MPADMEGTGMDIRRIMAAVLRVRAATADER